jgi:predicted nucleic acid-binding protein
VILLDSDIPMYLVGAAHPLKREAQRLVERAIAEGDRMVTDAEVLQEILHRYAAIGRREAIAPAFDVLLAVVDEVFPIEPADVERAKAIVLGSARLSARDALHLGVMAGRRVEQIMSFDAGFDAYPGVVRVSS